MGFCAGIVLMANGYQEKWSLTSPQGRPHSFAGQLQSVHASHFVRRTLTWH